MRYYMKLVRCFFSCKCNGANFKLYQSLFSDVTVASSKICSTKFRSYSCSYYDCQARGCFCFTWSGQFWGNALLTHYLFRRIEHSWYGDIILGKMELESAWFYANLLEWKIFAKEKNCRLLYEWKSYIGRWCGSLGHHLYSYWSQGA